MSECPKCQKETDKPNVNCQKQLDLTFSWRASNDFRFVDVEIVNLEYGTTKSFKIEITTKRIFQKLTIEAPYEFGVPMFDSWVRTEIIKRYFKEHSIELLQVIHTCLYFCTKDCLAFKETEGFVHLDSLSFIERYVFPELKAIDLPVTELTPDQLYETLDEYSLDAIEKLKESWIKDELDRPEQRTS